jgi:type I restriction enzyme, R subunit
VQIGLTATPRRLAEKLEQAVGEGRPLADDLAITADNLRHFGEPVYEYDISQGIEDGYLAACEITRVSISIDGRLEDEGLSISSEDLYGKDLFDADTGEQVAAGGLRRHLTR